MEAQLSAFLEYLQEEQAYSQNTIAAYRNDLGQFYKFVQVHYSSLEAWHELGDKEVRTYMENMKRQSYASSSIARKVAAVKSFFKFLFARGFVTHDPTNGLESPKVKKRKPQTLSPAEVERLLEAPLQKKLPKNLRDAALLGVLYATGMRVTEVVSLELSELDLAQSQLNCNTKEGHMRELPFDEHTHLLLEQYLESGRPYLAKNGEETALFLNHRGHQLTRQGLWLIIKAYARQAELTSDVTPHTLRHSFAAHKLNGGSDLQEVQQLLGHANISTTQIYTQLEEVAASETEETDALTPSTKVVDALTELEIQGETE